MKIELAMKNKNVKHLNDEQYQTSRVEVDTEEKGPIQACHS